MTPDTTRHVDLADGTTMHLADARGTTLRVTRGEVWLTQHHDVRDIVLAPGDTWTIERDGATLATALQDSTVAIVGAAAARVDEHGRRLTWADRAVAWLERFDEARVGRRWAPYV